MTVVPLLRDHPQRPVKGGLSKEVDSDKGEFSMGLTTFVTNKAGLTKEVVFHEGGLTKEVVFHEGGLSKEVVFHEGGLSQGWSLKRGGLSRGWSLKRGPTEQVPTGVWHKQQCFYMQQLKIHIYFSPRREGCRQSDPYSLSS